MKLALNWEVQGEGIPLVVLHGLFGSLDNWRWMAQRLSGEFQVFSVDQRNHGQSPHSPVFDYRAMVEDLEKFLDDRLLDRVHLLGHSMGGKTAMLFAAHYSERIDQLLVADIGPGPNPPRHDGIFALLQALPLDSMENRGAADRWLRERLPDPNLRGFLLKNLQLSPEGRLHWRFNLPVLRRNYDQILEALPIERPVEVPTLFLRGEHSDYLLPTALESLRQIFPRSRMVTLAGAGHWLHADQPLAFHHQVREFLRENPGP
jgi:pimeloyl-ACP methyl ester carboxylesterase